MTTERAKDIEAAEWFQGFAKFMREHCMGKADLAKAERYERAAQALRERAEQGEHR